MDIPVSYFVNFGFAWLLVLLAIVGYFLTLKRTGEKWIFWIILATGWALLATSYTLLIAGVPAGMGYLIAIWISSYVLVMASLILLFIKLTKVGETSQSTERGTGGN